MRLVLKLAAGMLTGMCLVLAVHGWLTMHREVETFRAEKAQAARLLGHALAAATSDTWDISGKQRALAFLKDVAARDSDVGIQWVDLKHGDRLSIRCPRLSADDLGQLADGQVVSIVHDSIPNEEVLCTFTPVQIKENRPGAIVIVTSLADQQEYVRSTAWRLAIAVLVILMINLSLSLGLGIFWMGRPIRKLIAKARAVGEGGYKTPLEIAGRDELTELAGEINLMSAKLATAHNELIREQQALLAAQTQLFHAERLATVGKLAAGIAHEIGTPLNVADGHAKMILSGQVQGEDAVGSSRVICRQTKRIKEKIQQLLRFSRRKAPKKEQVAVLQLALDTVTMLESLEKKSGVSLVVKEGDPLQALADRNQLQQVLTNLITNGIHAMPNGGQVSVGVSIEHRKPPASPETPEQDYCRITVEDQGEGITESNLPHIFDPFFTTKDVDQGTGLGLSIVHAIIDDHGGWIEVKSEIGKGSCFTIYLPSVVD
ncbi:MAG: HAMP domain-containing protein [Deltaproteobacteria bacterium]|nr:HAMP domain-containing protein [Deltaproteobacteria bacterium]